MADIVWPATLPQEAQLAGLSRQQASAVIRTAMEDGPAKVRRRSTAVATNWPITLKLTRTQLGLFDTFYRDSCKHGSLAFQWKNPQTGNLADFRFLNEPTASPMAPRLASGDYWTVTFSIELLPGTEITEVIPPIDGDPIPADRSIFVIGADGFIDDLVDAFAIFGVVAEAEAAPPDFFIGTFIGEPIEEDPNEALIGGNVFYVNSGTIPGGQGGHGNPPGGGGGVQP